MMKNEFEEIAGYQVSWNNYTKVIEPMYLATTLSKQEFCMTLDREKFDIKRIKKSIVKDINKLIDQYTPDCWLTFRDLFYDKLDELKEVLNDEYGEMDEFNSYVWWSEKEHDIPYKFFYRLKHSKWLPEVVITFDAARKYN